MTHGKGRPMQTSACARLFQRSPSSRSHG